MAELRWLETPSAGPSMLVLAYSLERLDFRPWACSVLGVDRLEDLHLRPDPAPFAGYVQRMNFYQDRLQDEFGSIVSHYWALAELIAPLFEGIDVRQNPPSFRCHLAGGGSVSAFHRDGDAKYGITPGVINAWVPLTTVGGNNSVAIEREWESEDYRPVALRAGEILLFDAYHLKHGSYSNDTQTTRVSFDFRFLPRNPARVRDLGLSAMARDAAASRP